MEIEIGEIEKEEVKNKKEKRKQYLYAVVVLGVTGLLFATATGVPIGAQFVTPALDSVAYFFGNGHGGHGLFVWYYYHDAHGDAIKALAMALAAVGIGWLWEKVVGTPLIISIEDALAEGASAIAEVIVELAPVYLDPITAAILVGVAVPVAVY